MKMHILVILRKINGTPSSSCQSPKVFPKCDCPGSMEELNEQLKFSNYFNEYVSYY